MDNYQENSSFLNWKRRTQARKSYMSLKTKKMTKTKQKKPNQTNKQNKNAQMNKQSGMICKGKMLFSLKNEKSIP